MISPPPSNAEAHQDHPACYKGDVLHCQNGRDRAGGCLTWHFFPWEGEAEMKLMFENIIKNNEERRHNASMFVD